MGAKAEAVRRVLFGLALIAAACKKDPAPAPPAATSAAPAPAAPSSSAATEQSPGSASDSAGVTRVPAEVGVGDELGYSVATVGDRVLVSSYKRKKTEELHPGSVFVFRHQGGKLERETELTVEGSHQIGNTIAFDGSVLLVGAHYDAGKSPETGAAYVFWLDDKGWSKGEKLSAPDGKKDDSFGIGVAIAGPTLVVGNSREAGGALYTWEKGKTGLSAKQTLPFKHPNGPAEIVAALGDTIVVGAPLSGKLAEQGVVVVYARDKAGFKPQVELTETEGAESQHFGSSVALAPNALAVTSDKQISLFERVDGAWKESARLAPPVTTGLADAALSLTDDALAVGLHLVDAGRVLLYKKKDGSWKLERTVRAPDGKNEDWFGYSVALSGQRLVVGAPIAAERTGAAYVLAL